jgi:hypothetical protein
MGRTFLSQTDFPATRRPTGPGVLLAALCYLCTAGVAQAHNDMERGRLPQTAVLLARPAALRAESRPGGAASRDR